MARWIRTGFVLTMVLAACRAGGEREVGVEDVQTKAQEALASAAALVSKEQAAHRRQLEMRLQTVTAKIESLAAATDELQGRARDGARARLEKLRAKRAALAGNLEGLRDKSGAAWESAREGLEQAVGDLEEGYESAKEAFE